MRRRTSQLWKKQAGRGLEGCLRYTLHHPNVGLICSPNAWVLTKSPLSTPLLQPNTIAKKLISAKCLQRSLSPFPLQVFHTLPTFPSHRYCRHDTSFHLYQSVTFHQMCSCWLRSLVLSCHGCVSKQMWKESPACNYWISQHESHPPYNPSLNSSSTALLFIGKFPMWQPQPLH